MRTIAVASFKGGTAKTSVALNLGAVLAKEHHKRVLLIDFDAQANLTSGLGYDPDEWDSLAQVLRGKRLLKEVILETSLPNLFLLPADTWLERLEVTEELASDRYSHERLKLLLKDLEFDYVFIDTPPSLCWLTESALIAANFCLISATPEFYSIKGLHRLEAFIEQIHQRHPLEVLGVLLSFWSERGKRNGPFLRVIEEIFPKKILQSKIRKDASVAEACIRGKPLVELPFKSRALEDFRSLANEIDARCKAALHLQEELLV